MRKRLAAGAFACLTLTLALAGCGGGPVPEAGANLTEVGPAGPTAPIAGPGRAEGAQPAPSGSADPASELELTLTKAVYWAKRNGNPQLQVAFPAQPSGPVTVAWHVSDTLADPQGGLLARRDAARILTLLQRTRLPAHASVLLLGSAATTQVVRAEYPAAALRAKTPLTPDQIWSHSSPPATLHPAYR